MEKKDNAIAIIVGVITTLCGELFKLDYSHIAESGLTLSSITLAVYIAAIVGLVKTDLAKHMAKQLSSTSKEMTQLGSLTKYFKIATFFSIATIVISSIVLLIPPTCSCFSHYFRSFLSIVGLVFYAENLVLSVMIIRFMFSSHLVNRKNIIYKVIYHSFCIFYISKSTSCA